MGGLPPYLIMTEQLDLSNVPDYDPYVKVDLKVRGKRQVNRKSDGKKFTILICEDEAGREVDLFDWGLTTRNGEHFVLRKHLNKALDTAKTRS